MGCLNGSVNPGCRNWSPWPDWLMHLWLAGSSSGPGSHGQPHLPVWWLTCHPLSPLGDRATCPSTACRVTHALLHDVCRFPRDSRSTRILTLPLSLHLMPLAKCQNCHRHQIPSPTGGAAKPYCKGYRHKQGERTENFFHWFLQSIYHG